jgi:FkbM family methyltransferase
MDRDPYLALLYRYCGSAETAVDVGSNVGLYTYSLSRRFKQVFAFEVNDAITTHIEKYNPGNIVLNNCGLSSATGNAKLFVPAAHGQTLTGWGTVHREILPTEFSVTEKACRLAALDDFALTGVGFIKIDVEGHEVEVLKGAAKTTEQFRPVVLIEVRYQHEVAVEDWFVARDYRQCRFDDNDHLYILTKYRETTGDCIYIPSERLAHFGLAEPN